MPYLSGIEDNTKKKLTQKWHLKNVTTYKKNSAYRNSLNINEEPRTVFLIQFYKELNYITENKL